MAVSNTLFAKFQRKGFKKVFFSPPPSSCWLPFEVEICFNHQTTRTAKLFWA
jgi:hypothetical protein